MRTLYIGSSFTNAFREWQRGSDRQAAADVVMCHGAFFMMDRLKTSGAIATDGLRLSLPRQFQATDDRGRLFQAAFTGNVVPPGGRTFTVDLSQYDRIVHTAMTLFQHQSAFELFFGGYGILTPRTAELFQRAGLTHPLSERAFAALHRAWLAPAYTIFEAACAAVGPSNVFVAPSVMPGENTGWPAEWLPLHHHEMDVIFETLVRDFAIRPMPQPHRTLTADFRTRVGFIKSDGRHYNTDFVGVLQEDYGFAA